MRAEIETEAGRIKPKRFAKDPAQRAAAGAPMPRVLFEMETRRQLPLGAAEARGHGFVGEAGGLDDDNRHPAGGRQE